MTILPTANNLGSLFSQSIVIIRYSEQKGYDELVIYIKV